MGRRLAFAAVATTVASCTLALGAPPAWGDSQDDRYMQQLKAYGLNVSTDQRDIAIEVGKAACDLKGQGLRDYDVNQELEAEYDATSSATIAKLAAVAILVYCPEYLHW